MILSGIDYAKLFSFEGIYAIFKGCGTAIENSFKTKPDLTLSVQKYRQDIICGNCPLNVGGQCDSTQQGEAVVDFKWGNEQRYKGVVYRGCGCFLICKTANLDEKCPLGKWLNVTV